MSRLTTARKAGFRCSVESKTLDEVMVIKVSCKTFELNVDFVALLGDDWPYQNRMATIHSTTIPCAPNTANRREETHICPYADNNVYGRFGVVRVCLCVFMTIPRVFVCRLRIMGESSSHSSL